MIELAGKTATRAVGVRQAKAAARRAADGPNALPVLRRRLAALETLGTGVRKRAGRAGPDAAAAAPGRRRSSPAGRSCGPSAKARAPLGIGQLLLALLIGTAGVTGFELLTWRRRPAPAAPAETAQPHSASKKRYHSSMCANYTPSHLDAISHHHGLERALFNFPDEAFPGYLAPILRESREVAGDVECVPAMFGMVPHWADTKLARQTYNARTETVATKPSFRNAWKRHQFCIIPAQNFYEPSYETGKPVRWRIMAADQKPLAIAGIWEWRPAGPDGPPLLSFSMLTINADGHPLMDRFHKPGDEKRMLVLLEPAQYKGWLGGELVNEADLYRPWPAAQLVAEAAPMPPRAKAKPAAEDALF